MAVQKKIIQRHIDEHLWFQHIIDREDRIADFIEKFGWIMREVYCGFICCERFDYLIAYDFLPLIPNQNNPGPKDILEVTMAEIIRKHLLDEHKWFQHIEEPEEAIKDFSAKFGWIVQELICGYACEQRFECPTAKLFLEENKKLEPKL